MLFPLPYCKVQLYSRQPVQAVLESLEKATVKPTLVPSIFSWVEVPFRGTVSGAEFAVRPNILGQNAFLPTIAGKVLPGPGGGAMLDCRMSPDAIVVALVVGACMIAWRSDHAVAGAVFAFACSGFVASAVYARRRLGSILAG